MKKLFIAGVVILSMVLAAGPARAANFLGTLWFQTDATPPVVTSETGSTLTVSRTAAIGGEPAAISALTYHGTIQYGTTTVTFTALLNEKKSQLIFNGTTNSAVPVWGIIQYNANAVHAATVAAIEGFIVGTGESFGGNLNRAK